MKNARQILFLLIPIFLIGFEASPALALVCGLLFGLLMENPFPSETKKFTKILLQVSVVGLGFGMNFEKVMEAGRDGVLYTFVTILFALLLGYGFGKLCKVEKNISYLISAGTAICGGSAIAAVSQVLKSDEHEIAVSIGTVFILNAVALLIFPTLGQYFHLTPKQFGLWCAIAIHDTSSVVGAAGQFGNEALMIATTVKLARTLWIIPLVFFTAFLFKGKKTWSSFPWFILLFVLASLASSYSGLPDSISERIVVVAKIGFAMTLYLIGTGISLSSLRKVGPRPLLQGVLLWICVIGVSLYWIA